MNKSGFKVYKVKDRLDSQKIQHELFDVPFRGIICAKSGQGKSLIAVNMLLVWYRKIFNRF